jgi:group I intron endonuclease
MGVIYKITSPSGRAYIGKTISLKRRISDYKYKLNGRESIVINSIKKYGWDAHKLEVVEEVSDELLDEREIFWIRELQTWVNAGSRGMNMTEGGEGQRIPWMHDTERRKRQSEVFTGEGNPFYGKTHTPEVREQISKIMSKRNKEQGIRVPDWGAAKGRLACIRPIIAYDSNGDFIGEYESKAEAAGMLNVDARYVASSSNKGTWVYGRYFFVNKTSDKYPKKIAVGNITVQNCKRPVLFLNKNYEVISEYPSALEASIDLGLPKTTINRASQYNNLHPIRKGHIFIYKDLYEKILRDGVINQDGLIKKTN